MNGQASLFDHLPPEPPAPKPRPLPTTAPYQAHSETSQAAAESLTPADLNEKQLAVLRYIRKVWSVTDNSLIEHFAAEPWCWSRNTPRPRRIELTKAKLVRDSGQRDGGSTVWEVTPQGVAFLKGQTELGP